MGAGGPDDMIRELRGAGEALASARPGNDTERDALEKATQQFQWVVNLLGERGVLSPADRKLLTRVGSRTPRVQLSQYIDKHAVTGSDIDCESLLHLCKARCCSFKVVLSEEDVLEGRLHWKIDDPYVLKREADGYCTHLEPEGGCGCYGARPAICRSYDCRGDRRVWLDFDAKVPAPLPSWLDSAQRSTEGDPDRRTPGSEPDEA
jgi:Fe-S-cluster containining protein